MLPVCFRVNLKPVKPERARSGLEHNINTGANELHEPGCCLLESMAFLRSSCGPVMVQLWRGYGQLLRNAANYKAPRTP